MRMRPCLGPIPIPAGGAGQVLVHGDISTIRGGGAGPHPARSVIGESPAAFNPLKLL